MYDMHKELNIFYNDHVCLSADDKQALAGYRDTNITRLKSGLEKLEYPSCFEAKNQGSYAMDTINQHSKKEYDIDVAIIFKKEDLPTDPADARKQMETAMCEAGGNFLTLPEAKTNAVRISYVEGYHVDLAVYREAIDLLGNPIIEHAGPEWTVRDPMEINNWFTELVQRRSPSKKYGAQVDDGQVRRVVRWLKMFSQSRSSWNMPGGLIISALVGECFIQDNDRDDVSLHTTMESIRNRLRIDKNVNNPVNPQYSLTERGKDKTRINNLETNLTTALEKMTVLFQADCDRQMALQAWNWVFNHPYWENEIGKCLRDSMQTGSLRATQTGLLTNTQSNNRSVPVPNTRFYGE
jgi:hypothetical protein